MTGQDGPTSAVDTTSSSSSSARSAGHEGSAPVQLTGAALLAAWGISVALHALIFIVMFVVPWLSESLTEEELPLARMELIGELEPTSFTPTQTPDLTEPRNTPQLDETRIVPQKYDALADLGTAQKPELTIIGIGAGGGDFERYGLNVGGGGGPEFFGLGGSAREARNIVFVVDRSGSMLETFDAVRQELRRSISAMRRSQRFHVIFFSKNPLENPPRKLVSAIRAQKQAFFEFLETVTPSGDTDPTGAMRRAFALEPDLVYFLTDGQFDPSLVDKLDQWNKDRKVRVFTIAYVSREGAELLEIIARNHRGEFRFVSEDDIFP